MATANQFTDGTVNVYNSITLSITNPTGATYTSAALTCIAETVTVTRAYKKILVENHLGVPVGAQYTRDHVTGSATIQVPALGTVEVGATFTVSAAFGEGSEAFVVTGADKSFSANDIIKQNISFAKVLSAIA